MRSKKSASKLAIAAAAAKAQANDLGHRIGPAAGDARDRIVPMVEDARNRIVPMVTEATESALETLAPAVEDAKGRLADLSESIATMLDENLPSKATPVVVEKHSSRSGGKVKKLLVLLGLGGVAVVVAQKLRGGQSGLHWHSDTVGGPGGTPSEAPNTTPATPASAVTGMVAADDPDVSAAGDDAAGGGSPDEAASDATETPHQPTTPDAPVELIDVRPPNEVNENNR